MFASQQSKTNDDITKLETLLGQLNKLDKTQWSGYNNINLNLRTDRKEVSYQIETALCLTNETH